MTSSIENGIYWIKITNVCSCDYCVTHIRGYKIELAKMNDNNWELFGTDEGISQLHPTEIEILEKVKEYNAK